jgi:UDP-N-acetylglucosamine acyltransferase
MQPQDLKYRGEPTQLEIGDDNQIREYTTMNRGTVTGLGITRVGSRCLFMAYSHIAHDCVVGNDVIMANAATLAGHVTIEDFATVGAFCAVHQFTRVGRYAYIGGGTIVTRDVLPYSRTVAPREAKAYGTNPIGLERRGFSKERIHQIHHAFRVLLSSKLNTAQALEKLQAEPDLSDDVRILIEFVKSSERGVVK